MATTTTTLEEQRARAVVRCALSWQVLLPEDLLGLEHGPDRPLRLLAELRADRLDEEIARTLARFVEDRRVVDPEALSEQDVATSDTGTSALLPTLLPERKSADDPDGTLAAEHSRTNTASGNSSSGLGTLIPATAHPVTLDPAPTTPATIQPERPRGETFADVGADAMSAAAAGATLAPVGTNAPDEDPQATLAPELSPLPEDASSTMEPERVPRFKNEVEVESRTLVPEDDTVEPASERETLGGRYLDIDLLPEADRQLVRSAAFARAMIARGLAGEVVREAWKAARKRAVLFEEHVVQKGVVDRAVSLELSRGIRRPRAVCGSCLLVIPEARRKVPCPECGQAVSAPTPTTSRTSGRIQMLDTSSFKTDPNILASAAPRVGEAFAGHELIMRIAEGGMGVVFKARDLNLNRLVALKVMRGGALASKIRRRRFLTEAEAAAALHHENIVPIHQISEFSGYPFYTMDFVEGVNLREYVDAAQRDPRTAAGLMRQVAEAVHHFHQRGIIHRDLKPANVLVNVKGAPQIIDFGIAKKISSDHEAEDSTIEGEVLGTPHYMPPEQASGSVQAIDTRSDVYALGAILYELLAGKPPFYGLAVAKIVLAIQNDDPVPLRTLNKELDRDLLAIVEKAMAKERERRYQSALDLADDLGRFLAMEPIEARPASLGYRLKKLIRRNWPAVSVGAAALALIVGGVYWTVSDRISKARAEAELAQAKIESAESEAKAARLEQVAAVAKAAEADAKAAQAEADRKRLAAETEAEKAKQAAERERQQLQLEADEQKRQKAEGEAQELAQAASGEGDTLKAMSILSEALAVLSRVDGLDELRTSLERRRASIALELADASLDDEEFALADYLIDEAQAVVDVQPDEEALAARLSSVNTKRERLNVSQKRLKEALEPLDEQRYGAARRLLASLDLTLYDEADREKIRDRLNEARSALRGQISELRNELLSLSEGSLAERARRSRELAGALRPDLEGDEALLADFERVLHGFEAGLAQAACREAALAWGAGERERARRGLSELEPQLSTKVKAKLASELALLEELARVDAGDDLVYVPALPGLELESAFTIARHEVTNAEFQEFVRRGGYDESRWWPRGAEGLAQLKQAGLLVDATGNACGPRGWQDGSFGDPANAGHPVRGITAYEARAYARWRSASDEHQATWRLPTRQEWEVAAGWDPAANAHRPYPWDSELLRPGEVLTQRSSQLVGRNSRDVSALGVRDMGGSVFEWVLWSEGGQAQVGLKGASFGSLPERAAQQARVAQTGRPAPAPSRFLQRYAGLRLVREIGRQAK